VIRVAIMALTLAGCATLERHPIATAVIVGIAAGSIAASASHCSAPQHDVTTQPVNCTNGSCK